MWANALSLLKSGINTYLRRHGMRAGAKFTLKQILNASGVGFAAQAGASAIGCAA